MACRHLLFNPAGGAHPPLPGDDMFDAAAVAVPGAAVAVAAAAPQPARPPPR